MNLTPEYKKYIEDCREKGMTDVQIRGALMTAGWNDSQVRDLFDAYRASVNPPSVTVPISAPAKLEATPLQKPEINYNTQSQTATPATSSSATPQNLAQRISVSKITPQVEPQPLRPQINHSAYNPPAQQTAPQKIQTNYTSPQVSGNYYQQPNQSAAPTSSPINQNTYTTPAATNIAAASTAAAASPTTNASTNSGISSYQPGSQLNTPLQTRSYYSEPPKQNYTAVGSNFSNNNPQVGEPVINESVVIKQKSPLKKVFMTVLILAFLLGGSAYAYIQFVNPFVLKKDDQVLMLAVSNMMNFAGGVKYENVFTGDWNNSSASFAMDFDYGGKEHSDKWNMRISSLTVEEKENGSSFSNLLSTLSGNLDVSLRHIGGDMYFYPGTSSSVISDDAENILFEKWIKFNISDLNKYWPTVYGSSLNDEFAHEAVKQSKGGITDLDYIITDSSVKDKKKHLTLQVSNESFAEYLNKVFQAGNITIFYPEETPSLTVSLIIDRNMWISNIDITANSNSGNATISSIVNPKSPDEIIIPPTESITLDKLIEDLGGELGPLTPYGNKVPEGWNNKQIEEAAYIINYSAPEGFTAGSELINKPLDSKPDGFTLESIGGSVEDIKEMRVDGKKVVIYSFVSSTNYKWYMAEIEMGDANHIEFGYSYKTENVLKTGDWEKIVRTIKFQ